MYKVFKFGETNYFTRSSDGKIKSPKITKKFWTKNKISIYKN